MVRRAAAGACKQGKAVAHPFDDLHRRKHPHARRGKLDGQGQAIEQSHNLGHCDAIALAQDKVRPLCRSASSEEIDGILGQGQRLNAEDFLTPKMEPLAAGDGEGGAGRLVEPTAESLRGVLHDLLEVVENNKTAAVPGYRVAELNRGVILAERDLECSGD